MRGFKTIAKIRDKLSSTYDNFFLRIVFREHKGGVASFIKVIALNFLLIKRYKKTIIGALWTKPSFLSKLASLIGINHNLNNLGNVYAIDPQYFSLSQKIERRVIEWTKGAFRCRGQTIEGYVTSGGTESNLFLMWTGREWLKKKFNDQCALIISDFTHYSVKKAGRILNLQEKRTPITEKTWSIDPAVLENTINKIYKEGTRNILLPITLGYSSTGACDPLKEILDIVRKLLKSHKDLYIFIWIDAAMQGLPLALLNNNFRPLSSPLVKGLVVDFHKLGSAPIPAGIVLYRGLLREMIQTPIDYLYEDDATISGSRPGFSALAIWANINSKRKRDWQKEFIKLNNRKENFIKKLYRYFPEAKVLSTKNSLTCAIVVNKHFRRLDKSIEDKFSLNLAKIKYSSVERITQRYLVHYKLNFLPGFDPFLFFKELDEIGRRQ